MELLRVCSTILVEDSGGVGVVTLNRPQRMNAWTPRMGVELRESVATLDARDDIRVIVVTGAGRGFCAGADLSPDVQAEFSREDKEAWAGGTPFWELNTPIIAAMNGAAVGLGSTWLRPRLVGVERAAELLLTGRIFRGREAVTLGVASEAVPADEVLDRALAIARDIAENVAPVSAALTKRLVYRFLTEPDRSGAERVERELSLWTSEQDDVKEGAAAFLEKRAPRWRLAKNNDFPMELFDA
jgi:enoyl-CoA hydratase/carnithine racemase